MNVKGYEIKRGADLQGANLQGADLRRADLRDADLRYVDLRNADLWGVNLRDADLRGADLRDAALWGADLRDAALWGADLRRADLQGANLRDADLRRADLQGANLRDADLRRADLWGANIDGCKFSPYAVCPEEGSFIAYKAVRGGVIKIRIPAEAARISVPTSRKCRAEYVKVIEGNGCGLYDTGVVYKEGETVYADHFDTDIRKTCTHGIHFFMTREEAENY